MYLGFQLINKTYISLKLTKNLKSKENHDIYPLLLILLIIILHNNKQWSNQL